MIYRKSRKKKTFRVRFTFEPFFYIDGVRYGTTGVKGKIRLLLCIKNCICFFLRLLDNIRKHIATLVTFRAAQVIKYILRITIIIVKALIVGIFFVRKFI